MKRLLAVPLALASPAAAKTQDPPEWSQPAPPFHVVGPIWYVGSKGLAAYLIRTSAGAILLDGTLAANVDGIEANIRSLGVPLRSVRVLLNSHAHFDHAEGLARLKRDTGARFAAIDREAPALESGTPPSVLSYGVIKFPSVKVDRLLRDGDTVRLGGVVLTAALTPGHTPGCTTWTMPVRDGARTLRVVFPCSLSVAGNRLIGNAGYPGIVADFRASFARVGAMRADVVLPAHPEQAALWTRHAAALAGRRDAFVDPALLGRIVADARAGFDRDLAAEQAKATR